MSDLVREKAVVTQDDLNDAEGYAADHDLRLEVIDGRIVMKERALTWQHMLLIRWLLFTLDSFTTAHQLGTVFPDGARYILKGGTDDIEYSRVPDLSFLRTGRIAADFDVLGDFDGAPDLAVEVLSRGQTNAELLQKIGEYLAAGTEEVWYILPRRRVLLRFRNDMDGNEIYTPGDTLETPLFPGLKLSLTELFNAGNKP
jgi:Uma2 family endonuclease